MNSKTPSILLVDDNHYNIMILEEYLSGFNYKLSSASDGEEAWLMLEESPQDYDIILLDWNMPKLNGIDVLKRIKADSRFNHVFVIMQTTNAMEEQIQTGMDAGADDYICKPYSEQGILSGVEKAVQTINQSQQT